MSNEQTTREDPALNRQGSSGSACNDLLSGFRELVRQMRQWHVTKVDGDWNEAANELEAAIENREDDMTAAISKLCGAIDVLRTGMGGHNHWDSTMRHDAGCEVCIEQRKAKQEASRLRDEALDLLAR